MKTSSRISMRVAAALLMAATLAGGCVMQKLGYVKKSTHDDLADQYTQAAAELNRLKMDNEAIGSMNEKDQAEARRLGAELANAQSTIADLQAQLEQASQPQTDPELLAIREQLKRLTGTGGLEWNDLKGTLVLRLHFALGRADIQD